MNKLCPELHRLISESDKAKQLAEQALLEFTKDTKKDKELRLRLSNFIKTFNRYEEFCKSSATLPNGLRIWAPDYIALENLAALNSTTIDEITSGITSESLLETRITSLDLSSQGLKTFGDCLKGLSQLTVFNIDSNNLSSLSGIEYLTNLTELSAYNNQLTSLAEIKNLTQLTELHAAGNQLNSLAGIENLTQLTKLVVHSNQLTSLAGIENLTQLTELCVYNNELTSLVGIENLAQLTKLVAYSNQLTSLAGIENLTQLTELVADNNYLTSLEIQRVREILTACNQIIC